MTIAQTESRVTLGHASRVAVKVAMAAHAIECLDEMEVVTDHDARLLLDVKASHAALAESVADLYRELKQIADHYYLVENANDRVHFAKRLGSLFLNVEA